MVKHEPQSLSLGSDGRAVGGDPTAAPGRQARRSPAQRGPARGRECPAVSAADRLCVAAVAARPGAVGHGLGLLPPLARRRDDRADPRHVARSGATRRRAGSAAERREHRQPVGQDGRKRGARGYDAGKKVKGRKRHLVVDTLGLMHGLKVHEGDIQDRDGARLVLEPLIGKLPRFEKLWGDGGYAGQLVGWVRERTGWDLEIVKRSDDMRGFVVLPKRWT